jgi:hypothetical protein
MRLRSQLAISGGVGVVGGAVVMGGALFLLRRTTLTPLVNGLGIWVLLAFLLVFSVAEIPMMITGMRYMVGAAPGAGLVTLTNAAFTFFAAVYAAPFLLLTGWVSVGFALASLSLVRFGGALWFVPGGRPREPGPQPSASGESQPTLHREER